VQRFPGHTRAFLKVQDGCNAFCSYCIVPYARGRSRSLPPEIVRERLLDLAGAGYREVVLTGIHLGTYGQDLTPPTNLVNLLQQIEDLGVAGRLRLSSIEPQEISEDLLRLFARSSIICPHMHIPLQSGDDTILSLMNRHYDRTFFRSIVEKILEARHETALGLDVMVGFPGEGENAFEQTYRLIEELPVAYLHVFPFSKRPGTPASTMKGQVREEDKKRRAQQLRYLGSEKRRLFMERFIGKRLRVLIEGRRDKKTGYLSGFSQNYLPVAVANGYSALVNTVTTVIPSEMVGGVLCGEAIHE
jgi:threonylcarbamoyladenosine tRNA methylthiotransferase MtaB